MRIFTYLLWIVLIILGASFALLNSQMLNLNYFFGHATIYFPFLLLLVLLIGALLGMFAVLPVIIRHKSKINQLKQRIKIIEQEIVNLRSIPIKDPH